MHDNWGDRSAAAQLPVRFDHHLKPLTRRFFTQRKTRQLRNPQNSSISTQKDTDFQPFSLESSIFFGSVHELKSGSRISCFPDNPKYPESLDFRVFLPYFHHFKLNFTAFFPKGNCVVEFQVFLILKSKLCKHNTGTVV